MDDETKKVYMCRDVVFNETDFGALDHIDLETGVAEQLPNCQQEGSVPPHKVEVPQVRDRPKRQTREPNWYRDTVIHCVYGR